VHIIQGRAALTPWIEVLVVGEQKKGFQLGVLSVKRGVQKNPETVRDAATGDVLKKRFSGYGVGGF